MAKIDTSNWKKFKFSDLFVTFNQNGKLQVPTGARVAKDLVELDANNGGIPRITVAGVNNGIYGYYADRPSDKDYRVYNNFISISFLGAVFYQKGKASLDMKVHCLKPINHIFNDYTGKYMVTAILACLRKSSYADQISSTVLPNLDISLPVDANDAPDWKYMEEYIQSVEVIANNSLSRLIVALS